MPKTERRLLVIAYFHRKLVAVRVRMLLAIGVFRACLTAYTHREVAFWAENCVFGRQTVPKPRRRLLGIAHLYRKLLLARVRMLLAIGVFRVWLTAYTHRKLSFLPKSALKCNHLLEDIPCAIY